MTCPWKSVVLRGIVVCLGMLCCGPTVGWGQDPGEKLVEDARKTLRDAENARNRADLKKRQELEVQVFDLELELQQDQLNLESKRKKRDELNQVRQKLALPKPQGELQPPVFGGDLGPGAPVGAAGMGPVAAGAALENAFVDRKVHVLLYGNINDPKDAQGRNIGEGVVANLRFLQGLFQHQLGSRAVIVSRTQFNSLTIQRDIANLAVAAPDAVVVYISTHGAFLPNGDQILSQSGTADGDIRRSVVMDGLRKKTNASSQLRVLISDSCAVYTGSPPVWPRIEAEPYPTQVLFRLLLTTTGEISVNAAIPGKSAYYYPSRTDDGGGFFTRAFVYTSVYGQVPATLTGKEADWLPFLREVSARARLSPGQPPACSFDRTGRPSAL